MRADFGRLIHLGKPRFGNPGSLGHFLRPAAMGHVEQQRARGLLHVDCELAREPVAHIVLGTHDVANLGEDLRLMRLDPQQLGQCEIRQSGIAGELDQLFIADLLVQPVALRLGAGVAPDKRRPEHGAVLIKHHGAVHLSCQADACDGLSWLRRRRKRGTNRLLRGAPPVLWILLRPAGVRGAKGRMLTRSAADQLAVCIHHYGPRAARTHIHSQEPHRRLPRL